MCGCVCVCVRVRVQATRTQPLTAFQHPHATNAALRSNSRAMAAQLDTKSEADATTTSLDTAAKAAFASGRHEEAAALFGQLLLTGAPEPHLVLCNRSAAWGKAGEVGRGGGRRAARDGFLAAELREGALPTGVCAAGLRAAGRGAQLGFGSGLSSARLARSLPQLQLRTL